MILDDPRQIARGRSPELRYGDRQNVSGDRNLMAAEPSSGAKQMRLRLILII
jgi:hypothetical protein